MIYDILLIIAVLAGLRGASISPPSQQQLSYVIFTTPMIIMFLGMVATAIYLNVSFQNLITQ